MQVSKCARESGCTRGMSVAMGAMRMGIEIYKGMSGPLRAGVEKYDICDEQYAWE